jgi:pseudaminic acid cytidylyltransferase
MKQSIAIITARGGSKRIPRKNIRLFCGKPIIAYSIEVALSSRIFDEVMVSTDDEEIAAIATQYGARVPFFRSSNNSDDFSTTFDVLREVLQTYEETEKKTFSRGCCIYPTAPLLSEECLKYGMKLLEKDGAMLSVIPIVKFGFPIQRAFRCLDGKLEYMYPEYAQRRSQDLEAAYHDAGQFYCFNTKALLEKKALVDKTTKGIVVSEMTTQDIDSESDWNLAELKWHLKNETIIKNHPNS